MNRIFIQPPSVIEYWKRPLMPLQDPSTISSKPILRWSYNWSRYRSFCKSTNFWFSKLNQSWVDWARLAHQAFPAKELRLNWVFYGWAKRSDWHHQGWVIKSGDPYWGELQIVFFSLWMRNMLSLWCVKNLDWKQIWYRWYQGRKKFI